MKRRLRLSGNELAILYKEAATSGHEEFLDMVTKRANSFSKLKPLMEAMDLEFFFRFDKKARSIEAKLFELLSIRSQDIDSDTFWKLAEHVYGTEFGPDTKGLTFDSATKLLQLADDNPHVKAGLPVHLQEHITILTILGIQVKLSCGMKTLLPLENFYLLT